MGTRELLQTISPADIAAWPRPDLSGLDASERDCVERRIQAVSAVVTGASAIAAVARHWKVNRNSLSTMIHRALELAADGRPWGYRACVRGSRSYKAPPATGVSSPSPLVDRAGAHRFTRLIRHHPELVAVISAYRTPLSRGRLPPSFTRLHRSVVAFLEKRHGRHSYPLNLPDQGRRALLRYVRAEHRRCATADAPTEEPVATATTLSDLFHAQPFDRLEIDAHHLDLKEKLSVRLPNGSHAMRPGGTLWLLALIDVMSRAIVAWVLVVGRSYTSLELSRCIAQALIPWAPLPLTIPGLRYAPGAALPSGFMPTRRALLVALDNALAHHAHVFQDGFCRSHGGILNHGRAHIPEIRGVVEQLFSRLERGAIREIAGGFEPSKTLGEPAKPVSNRRPDDYPFRVDLFEQLLDVIITGYNATAHPSLGMQTPLQFLQAQATPSAWWFERDDGEACAADLTSVLAWVTVRGDARRGISPHVNFENVKYRIPAWSKAWERIGERYLAKSNGNDLRTLVLLKSGGVTPVAKLVAAAPWHCTAHSLTTRRLIFAWIRRGKLSLNGSDCAIEAYHAHLKEKAHSSAAAASELVKFDQAYASSPARTSSSRPNSKPIAPRGGWVSFGKTKDSK